MCLHLNMMTIIEQKPLLSFEILVLGKTVNGYGDFLELCLVETMC